MIKVASYNPHTNNGQPRIYAQVRKPTRWRVTIFAKLPDEIEQRVILRVQDPMWISEVHEQATEALRGLIPSGAMCERAGFELWADA